MQQLHQPIAQHLATLQEINKSHGELNKTVEARNRAAEEKIRLERALKVEMEVLSATEIAKMKLEQDLHSEVEYRSSAENAKRVSLLSWKPSFPPNTKFSDESVWTCTQCFPFKIWVGKTSFFQPKF